MSNDELIKQSQAQSYRNKMCGKIYKHFKGDLYRVDNIALDSTTLELLVVYHSIVKSDLVWIRPLDEFLSPVDKVKYPDAIQELRFQPTN